MRNVLEFLSILALCCLLAHGSLKIEDSGDGIDPFTCVLRFQDFLNTVNQLERKKTELLKEFVDNCKSVIACNEKLSKTSEDQDSIETGARMVAYCEAVKWITLDFKGCGGKLEGKKSTCYEGFDEFPEYDETGKKEKVDQKEGCKNFFGKGNCMKKEVMDTCGGAKWEELKKALLSAHKHMDSCDFD